MNHPYTSRLPILLAIILNGIVLHAQQTETETERRMSAAGLVDVALLDSSLAVDLMYTRADNFTGKILYTDLFRAYLHPEAAEGVVKAQKDLKRTHPHLSLKIYDASRPMHVQQKMWNVVAGTSKSKYVSNPKNGGGLHNYGLAVDVTLCVAATGDTLDMGTPIDHLGPLAHIDREEALAATGQISREALENRRLLRRVMKAGGFRPLRSEWWHFNLRTRAEAKARYRVVP